MRKGKREVTMTRDAFHVYLTLAMLVGIYLPSFFVMLVNWGWL